MAGIGDDPDGIGMVMLPGAVDWGGGFSDVDFALVVERFAEAAFFAGFFLAAGLAGAGIDMPGMDCAGAAAGSAASASAPTASVKVLFTKWNSV